MLVGAPPPDPAKLHSRSVRMLASLLFTAQYIPFCYSEV